MSKAIARLEVVAGRAIGMWILFDDDLLIGRHAEGAGRLADDEEISRSHARLSLDRTGFCAIEDLGSTNGTYVNGLRITGPETLSEGDTIEVGGTTLVVRDLPISRSEHTLPTRRILVHGTEGASPTQAHAPGNHSQAPDNLSLKLDIDWEGRTATMSIGDEKPLRLVLEGDTWRPASDAS